MPILKHDMSWRAATYCVVQIIFYPIDIKFGRCPKLKYLQIKSHNYCFQFLGDVWITNIRRLTADKVLLEQFAVPTGTEKQ